MFSSCKELAWKSLADDLLKDDSWLEEGVDAHRMNFRPRSMFV